MLSKKQNPQAITRGFVIIDLKIKILLSIQITKRQICVFYLVNRISCQYSKSIVRTVSTL